MHRWAAFPLRLYVMAACVCLLAPILIVVILAFSGEGYLHFPPTSLSLQWFARFFGDSQWQHALLSSLVIGAIACLVSTTVGFFAAYAFLRAEFRGKKLVLSLMLTPIIVPSIITAIAMYYLAGRLGLIGNFLWLGLCHAVIAMPIVLLILLAALHAVDPNLERAALGLGGSRLRVPPDRAAARAAGHLVGCPLRVSRLLRRIADLALSRRRARPDPAGADLEQPQFAGRANDRRRQCLSDRGDDADPGGGRHLASPAWPAAANCRLRCSARPDQRTNGAAASFCGHQRGPHR